MSYGLNFQVNYAWSKSLDTGTGDGHGSGIDVYQNAYNPAANYGLSDFDAANTLVGQVVYELPFGRGRKFVLHGPARPGRGWLARVQCFPVARGNSVHPGDSELGCDGRGSGAGSFLSSGGGATLFPEQVGDPHVSNPSIRQWFNPAAYANPAPGTFGNAGRNSLIGPGFADVDFSIGKEFSLRERMELEIRADMFNAFNHINYANPDANVGYTSGGALADSTAGTITNPAGFNSNMRIIQLGAHFTF